MTLIHIAIFCAVLYVLRLLFIWTIMYIRGVLWGKEKTR